MLRPNYETTFARIVEKLTGKQTEALEANKKGDPSELDSRFAKYPAFVMFQIIENLASDYPNSENMNQNLDYLLNQWDY